MKEIVTWAVTIWDMYWGNGWVQYLLALSGIGILILGRKKGIALRLFFLYGSSAGVVFLSCIRTRDYALYRRERILESSLAFAYSTCNCRRFYRSCEQVEKWNFAGSSDGGSCGGSRYFRNRHDKSWEF